MRTNTKQKIIETTTKLIDTNGVDAVSMREIGKQIGLSRSAVYRHFDSKEDLLSIIARQNFKYIKDEMIRIIHNIDDSKMVIKEFVKNCYKFGTSNQEHYKLMYSKEWNKDKYFELKQIAYEVFILIEDTINKIEKDKKKSKELTAILFAFIHGLIDLNNTGHNEEQKNLSNVDSLIDSFISILFN